MPTVTYKCKDSGKTKKKTFAYNAMGKAQSTEFAKLMGGSKKNNPGPGEEVMSTKDRAAKRAAKQATQLSPDGTGRIKPSAKNIRKLKKLSRKELKSSKKDMKK